MDNKLITILILLFVPTLIQFTAKFFESYSLGLLLKFTTHLIIPVIILAYYTKLSLYKSFLVPFKTKKKKIAIKHTLIGSFLAFLFIFGSYILLYRFIDFSQILLHLKSFNVTIKTYPFVALAIILTNPLLEEYFWRGFIFRNLKKYNLKFGYLTGLLFALHHVIIFAGWFLWWQYILVTVFLAIVGIYFNWLYQKTGSIHASLIIHIIADIIIVGIGYFEIFHIA